MLPSMVNKAFSEAENSKESSVILIFCCVFFTGPNSYGLYLTSLTFSSVNVKSVGNVCLYWPLTYTLTLGLQLERLSNSIRFHVIVQNPSLFAMKHKKR